MPHPLVAVVARTLPGSGQETAPYLALLERRMAVLGAGQWPAPASRGEAAAARRVLARIHAQWDDCDENRVRGYLDGWLDDGEDARAAAIRAVNAAAAALATTEARPATIWFFLWELESVLESPTA